MDQKSPWETEAPEVYRTRANVFRYYPKQGLLGVSKADYIDRITGQPKVGKTILIPLHDLAEEPDVIKALVEILENAE